MLCINPHSVSSQMAPNSRACLRHQAVLSGMLAGTIVPYHFEKESAGSAAALPSFRRPACAKNNAFLIARSNWKKHHMSERRNHFWIDRARERTSFWWQPLPDQEKQDLNSRKRTYTHSTHNTSLANTSQLVAPLQIASGRPNSECKLPVPYGWAQTNSFASYSKEGKKRRWAPTLVAVIVGEMMP